MPSFLYKKIIFLIILFQFGCSLPYLIKSGYHQSKILYNRVPIDNIIKDPLIATEVKRKLSLAQKAKFFSENTLHLKTTKNYSSYVQLERPYVSYILQVAHRFELKQYKWWFPIIGNVPYKGFPNRIESENESNEFPPHLYDKYIRGVSAYSTLGWFDDPILSSMINYSDHNLINLIIHETVHATIFIKNQSDFNERLATFIANKGTHLFYQSLEGKNAPTIKIIENENHDEMLFSKFISSEINELRKWYITNKNNMNILLKKNRLKKIQNKFKKNILPKMLRLKYSTFQSRDLDNAYLLSLSTYYKDLSIFEKAFKHYKGHFYSFLNFCKSLEKVKNPEQSLVNLVNSPN